MNRLFWVALYAFMLVAAYTNAVTDSDGTFEAGNYHINLSFPNFTLQARFKNGSAYQDQYLLVALDAAEEGVARTTGSGTTFNATRSWSQDVLRANYTVSSFSETVFLSGGNVTATRDVLHSYAILPNGANLTLRFEVYDQDGTMEWGSNTVSIKANRVKYTAFISNWNLEAPGNRVRLMITGTYVSGPYDIASPSLEQVGWTGPARHLVITWPPNGPLKETVFDTDVWAVADGVVGNIQLAPNPVTSPSYIDFHTTYPQYEAVTFGYVLPYFNSTLAWDPNVLMTLFSDDPSSPQANKSNFDRNRNIIIGCVVGGIALIVLVIVVAFVIFKKKDGLSQRSRLSDGRAVTDS